MSQIGAHEVCVACVPVCAWAGGASRSRGSNISRCHLPPGGPRGRRPERQAGLRDRLAVTSQGCQTAAPAPRAPAPSSPPHSAPLPRSPAEASGLFLEPGPSLDAESLAEISSGQTHPSLGIFWKRETEAVQDVVLGVLV